MNMVRLIATSGHGGRLDGITSRLGRRLKYRGAIEKIACGYSVFRNG